MDSILETIKKMLGIPEEVKNFDVDVMIAINTSLNALTQNGVGPEEGFRIQGPEESWSDFIGDDSRFDSVKEYVYLKTKMLFDPTQTSSIVMECYRKLLEEIEWRLNVQADPYNIFEGGENSKNE